MALMNTKVYMNKTTRPTCNDEKWGVEGKKWRRGLKSQYLSRQVELVLLVGVRRALQVVVAALETAHSLLQLLLADQFALRFRQLRLERLVFLENFEQTSSELVLCKETVKQQVIAVVERQLER